MSISFETEVRAREVLIDMQDELDRAEPDLDRLFELSSKFYHVLCGEVSVRHRKSEGKRVRFMAEYFKQQRLFGND